MRKALLSLVLILSLMLPMIPTVQAAGLDVPAPSAILMDAATGTVLWEKNAHERLAPASVTKIMTLLLVMESPGQRAHHLGRHRHHLRRRCCQGRQPGLS